MNSERQMTDEELFESVKRDVEKEYRDILGVNYNQQKADEQLLKEVREEVAKEYREFVEKKDKNVSSGSKLAMQSISDNSEFLKKDYPASREQQLRVMKRLKQYYEEMENEYHNGMHM